MANKLTRKCKRFLAVKYQLRLIKYQQTEFGKNLYLFTFLWRHTS